MNRQKLFIFLLLFAGLFAADAAAQNVYVYSKIGKFFVRKGKKDTPVNVQSQLARTDILVVPAKGKIVLFDPENRKEIEIRTSYEGISSVEKLITNNETTTVSGTENPEGKYYELQPIAIAKGTQYVLTKGSKESIVMLIKLEPIAE